MMDDLPRWKWMVRIRVLSVSKAVARFGLPNVQPVYKVAARFGLRSALVMMLVIISAQFAPAGSIALGGVGRAAYAAPQPGGQTATPAVASLAMSATAAATSTSGLNQLVATATVLLGAGASRAA